MTEPDEVREALSTPAYESAFTKAMTGRDVDWTDEEREAVRRARAAYGADGPGLRMPWRLDPTVPADQRTPDG